MVLHMQWILAILCLALACSTVRAEELPDAPSRAHFIMLTSTLAGVVAEDCHQTLQVYRETSSPWLYGTYPREHPGKVIAIMSGEVAAASLVGYYLRKTRFHKFWWVPQTALIVSHGWGVVHNARIGYY